jgi:hypothetical protein
MARAAGMGFADGEDDAGQPRGKGRHAWLSGLQALRDRIITRTTTAFVLDPDCHNVEAVCHAPA